jgi:hypothetical protein
MHCLYVSAPQTSRTMRDFVIHEHTTIIYTCQWSAHCACFYMPAMGNFGPAGNDMCDVAG